MAKTDSRRRKGNKAPVPRQPRLRLSRPIDHSRCFITGMPNELLQNFVLDQMSPEDGVCLALTSKTMRDKTLPEVYRKDACVIENGDVPFALQWACYYGSKATVEASISAIEIVGGDAAEVIQRRFEAGTLHDFTVDRGPLSLFECSGTVGLKEPGPYFRPLDICILRGHTAIADLLIQRGADIACQPGRFNTPLHWVVNPKVAQFLVNQGAVVNALDNEATNPLLAVMSRHTHTKKVEEHPSHGQNEVHRDRGNGALEQDHTVPDVLATIRYLLQAGTIISPTIPDPVLFAHPLQFAVKYLKPQVLQVLLDAGVNPNPGWVATTGPQMLLQDAILKMCPAKTRLLLDAGAVVEISAPDNLPNVEPFSAIQEIMSMKWRMSVEWVQLADMICQRSDRFHSDVQYGRDLLRTAMKNGQWSMAMVLKRRGAIWDAAGEFIPGRSIRSLLDYMLDKENKRRDAEDAEDANSARFAEFAEFAGLANLAENYDQAGSDQEDSDQEDSDQEDSDADDSDTDEEMLDTE